MSETNVFIKEEDVAGKRIGYMDVADWDRYQEKLTQLEKENKELEKVCGQLRLDLQEERVNNREYRQALEKILDNTYEEDATMMDGSIKKIWRFKQLDVWNDPAIREARKALGEEE